MVLAFENGGNIIVVAGLESLQSEKTDSTNYFLWFRNKVSIVNALLTIYHRKTRLVNSYSFGNFDVLNATSIKNVCEVPS